MKEKKNKYSISSLRANNEKSNEILKKLLSLLFILSLFIQNVDCQIISFDWSFRIGDKSESIRALNQELIQEPEGGVDKVWDFSELIPLEDSETKSEFINPIESNYSSSFPDANIVASQNGSEGFYLKTADSLLILGVKSDSKISFDFGRSYLFFKEIMSLRDSFVADVVYQQIEEGGNTIALNFKEVTTLIGIGTVITPEGEFDNCLLFKRERKYPEYIPSENTISYSFRQNSLSKSIAGMSRKVSENEFSNFGWGINFEEETTSYQEINKELDIRLIYHDNKKIRLEVSSDMELNVQLYDITGRNIFNFQKNFASGTNQINNKHSLNSGNYILMITDRKSQKFKTFKLSVVQ